VDPSGLILLATTLMEQMLAWLSLDNRQQFLLSYVDLLRKKHMTDLEHREARLKEMKAMQV
jgi:hypothetical protein